MAQNSSVQTPSLVTMSAQPFANENDPSKERPLMSRRSKLARRFMNAVQWAGAAAAVLGSVTVAVAVRVWPPQAVKAED